MTFGLPSHLAPAATSAAFASAVQSAAFVMIVCAAIVATTFQARMPELVIWPAALVLLPMMFALIVLDRRRNRVWSITYLVVGAAAVYVYTLTFATQLDIEAVRDGLPISLPKVALLLVGGAGVGPLSALRWCTTGYILAESAHLVARLQAQSGGSFDLVTTFAYAVASLILLGTWLSFRRGRATGPLLATAARDEVTAALRFRIEQRAAALMHDTILNHLVAISTADHLPAAARTQIESDLAAVADKDWLSDSDAGSSAANRGDWHDTLLYEVVEEMRAGALDVDVTGDPAAALGLAPNAARALALAVKQCLVNVEKHSGVLDAEVAVHAGEAELLVMVIDTGRGFDESEVPSDRLGLKNSIRARIEEVGGGAQIWSTVGRGTSVVLRVPLSGRVVATGSATVNSGDAS